MEQILRLDQIFKNNVYNGLSPYLALWRLIGPVTKVADGDIGPNQSEAVLALEQTNRAVAHLAHQPIPALGQFNKSAKN